MKMMLKESPLLMVFSLLVSYLQFGLPADCATEPAKPSTVSELQRFQGTWEGVILGQDGDNKATLTITGNALHYLGQNSREWWEATFALPPDTNPQQLHATITGPPHLTNEIGSKVYAIFKIDGGTLTLVPNQDPKEPVKSIESILEKDKNTMRYELQKVQLQGQNAKPAKANEKLVFVAVMNAEPKTLTHIHGRLRAAGIHFEFEGARISELSVARRDVERAVGLLKTERAAGWLVSFVPYTL